MTFMSRARAMRHERDGANAQHGESGVVSEQLAPYRSNTRYGLDLVLFHVALARVR